MKIAIPTRNNRVDDHFGHCENFTIFSVDPDKQIEYSEIFESPEGCGCRSDVAKQLRDKGVTVMLAGNMGAGAYNKISREGIKVYRGCSAEVRTVAEAFLEGNIIDSEESCHQHLGQHQHRHQCRHGHHH